MQIESRKRSIVKAVSYRFFGTLITCAISFVFTGKSGIALAIGGIDFVAKIITFFLHERIWSQVQYGKHEVKPVVVWFTGLSGSGKTTLAKNLVKHMQNFGFKVEYLDGDRIRKILPGTGFSQQQREDHIRRVGLLASYLQKHGVSVVTALISPYEESRQFVRQCCDQFIEIHLSTPLEICEKRDVKGLYARARQGEIKNFTGIDDPYEIPKNPEISINTAEKSIEDAMGIITPYLEKYLEINKRGLRGLSGSSRV